MRQQREDKMNLRGGSLRFGIGLAALWFVFWSFAYGIGSASANAMPASLAVSIAAWSVLVPCLIAAVVLGGWATAGFRSN
jgi:hypothetical protein